MAITETPGYRGNLPYAKVKTERLTATNAAWIAATTATSVIVVLSLTWVVISGTNPTLQINGASNYPGGSEAFQTATNEPHQHFSAAGLVVAAAGGDIGVTLAGTSPVIAVSATYVEYEADGTLLGA